MSTSAPEPDSEVLRWLRFALEDLQAAEQLLRQERFTARHACWLSQQAVEKALKSELIYEQIQYPYRHDLDALRNLLPDDWKTKQQYPDLAELTEWAVEARYPGDWPDATTKDAKRAVEQARAVFESVVEDFVQRGVQVPT